MTGIMSVRMPMLSIKDLAVAAFHVSGACWGKTEECPHHPSLTGISVFPQSGLQSLFDHPRGRCSQAYILKVGIRELSFPFMRETTEKQPLWLAEDDHLPYKGRSKPVQSVCREGVELLIKLFWEVIENAFWHMLNSMDPVLKSASLRV